MVYLFLFLFSLTLTWIIKKIFVKKQLLAPISERSSHTTPIPHGGGIAIALTWFIGLIYLFWTNQIETSLFYALIIGFVISIVSYADDLFELSAKLRLLVQSGVAIGGIIALGGLHSLDLGMWSIENPIITNLFAFLLIVWYINLYNFLDGIDGYAGSEALFLALSGFLLFGGEHFLLLFVAVLGFLFWNWHKAKIFMGDVGSTLLGYSVAIFTLHYANTEATNLWVWIILFALFWFDATLTLYRRYKNRENLSLAHKKHAYQRITQSGWSHSKVVLFSLLINALIFAFIFFIPNIFVALLLTLLLLLACGKFIDSKKPFL